MDKWNEYFFSSLGRYQPEYIIGNDPDFVQMPMANGVFVGAVMDFYVTGIALSVTQIGDLIKGKSSIQENALNYLSVDIYIFSTKALIGDTIFILPFADVKMSDIEEAAPENSLTDLSDSEIEIEIEIEIE